MCRHALSFLTQDMSTLQTADCSVLQILELAEMELVKPGTLHELIYSAENQCKVAQAHDPG